MRQNELLSEKTDHGHYTACFKRKEQIDKCSKRIFAYTLVSGFFMLILTAFTVPLGALSWIPSLFGNSETAGYIIVQCLEIILLALTGGMGCGKNKFFGIVPFTAYLLMIFGCLAGGIKAVDSLLFLFGTVGAIISFPSIYGALDYRQLMQTEGYPYFSRLLTEEEAIPLYPERNIPRSSDLMSTINSDTTRKENVSEAPELVSDTEFEGMPGI